MEKMEPDYEKCHPHFTWQPVEIIKKTFEMMTQHGSVPEGEILKNLFKSPNPALNIA